MPEIGFDNSRKASEIPNIGLENATFSACCGSPTDLCLTDLDRILPVEQDPGAHHYSVPGTVPIKEEPLRFWVPMQILY